MVSCSLYDFEDDCIVLPPLGHENSWQGSRYCSNNSSREERSRCMLWDQEHPCAEKVGLTLYFGHFWSKVSTICDASEKLFCSYNIPLVADIHFAPSVALRVAECFDKIRVNPGNFGMLFIIPTFSKISSERLFLCQAHV